MAKGRKLPAMSEKAFTYSLIHKHTLQGWSGEVRIPELLEAMKERLTQMCNDYIFDFVTPNPRLVASIAEVLFEVIPGERFRFTINSAQYTGFGGLSEHEVMEFTLMDIAEGKATHELMLFMITSTYRGLTQHVMGPLPGNGVTLTIAGMLAVCMILGVQINVD